MASHDSDQWTDSATEAAIAMTSAMTTPLWPVAKGRIILLLDRDDPFHQGQLGLRLEESRAAVTRANGDQQVRTLVAARWAMALMERADGDNYAGMSIRNFTDTVTYLLRVYAEREDDPPVSCDASAAWDWR